MSKDSELKKVVLDELSWEPSVDAAHIGVTAKDGVITLTGHVDNYSNKAGAEKAASRVKGVKAVVEEIEVKLPYDVKRSDEDIAAAAIDRLGWNSSIPDGAIQVKVEKGWVTLSPARSTGISRKRRPSWTSGRFQASSASPIRSW
jgi:osmotically-inducible protein OsmY